MQFSENEHLPKEDKRGGGTLLHYGGFSLLPSVLNCVDLKSKYF